MSDQEICSMDVLEPQLHAFCTPTPELALEHARENEKDILAGRPVGPLAGVPIGIKDLVCTKGIKTVSGSFAYQDFVSDVDDVVVERLIDAGAVILGKTNMPAHGHINGHELSICKPEFLTRPYINAMVIDRT